MVTMRAEVIEKRPGGETWQSGDFFLTEAGSQIPRLAHDERIVHKESLAQEAYVSVWSDCEILMFAHSYSTGAQALVTVPCLRRSRTCFGKRFVAYSEEVYQLSALNILVASIIIFYVFFYNKYTVY